MLEAAEADLALEAGFVHVKARPGIPGNWPPSSSTRTNGVSGFAMAASVLSLAARTYRAPPKLRDRTPFGHAHDAAGCI